MGIDPERFVPVPPEEFICSICSLVFEDPVQRAACEHIFCKACITHWINLERSCPVDRGRLTLAQLTRPPRVFLALLGNLKIKCSFSVNGCKITVELERLSAHQLQCEFRPDFHFLCTNSCGALITGANRMAHSCVDYLKFVITKKEAEMKTLKEENKQQAIFNKFLEKQMILKNSKICTLTDKVVTITSELNKKTAEYNKAQAELHKKTEVNDQLRGEKVSAADILSLFNPTTVALSLKHQCFMKEGAKELCSFVKSGGCVLFYRMVSCDVFGHSSLRVHEIQNPSMLTLAPDKYYDGIYCYPFVENSNIRVCGKKLLSVLKKGGRMLFYCIEAGSFRQLLIDKRGDDAYTMTRKWTVA